jgi:broad specificity phosphatase PhoE
MKTAYIVRHGQTVSNAKQVTGKAEDPLSELGEQQAGLIAERFRELQIDAVLSSPYRRAEQTAEAIAAINGLTVEHSDLLIEVKSPSILSGRSSKDPEVSALYKRRTELWGVRGEYVDDEENFYDVDSRVQQALALLAAHPAQHLAVATHGAFIKSIIEHILLGELLTPALTTRMYNRFTISNTAVTVLRYENETWHVVRVNDTIHLSPEHETV